MKTSPKWAQDLMINVLLQWEKDNVKVSNPSLIWRRGSGEYSSGCVKKETEIIITAGKSKLDQKLVLLHEIAHTLVPSINIFWNIERAKKRGWMFSEDFDYSRPCIIKSICHTPAFWDTAWKLYRWAKLPIKYCLKREGYYKGALIAYKKQRMS